MLRQVSGSETSSVVQLARDWRSLELPEEERLMLEFAEKVALDSASVQPDDLGRLRRAGFDDEDILQIAVVASYYSLINRLTNALGSELDENSLSDETLVAGLTVGRDLRRQ